MILIDYLVVFVPHSNLMGGKLANIIIKSVFGSSQYRYSVGQNGLGAGHGPYRRAGWCWDGYRACTAHDLGKRGAEHAWARRKLCSVCYPCVGESVCG